MNNELRKSYDESIKIIKNNSESFYTAFKNLSEEKFLGVASLYAFCRTCDDIVDDEFNKSEAEEKLNDIEKNLRAFYNNEPYSISYPWWEAFKETVKKFDIDIEAFLMQIQGQRMDLLKVEIEDLDELIEYSKLVAGSVGLMLGRILAKSDEKSRDRKFLETCIDLGIGMQITNILRDIGEDLTERNRIYIPKTLLEKYGLDKEDLKLYVEKQGENLPEKFIALWEELAKISDEYYRGIRSEICSFDPDVRLGVFSAVLIYREILAVVRKNGYNSLTKRNYTDKLTRLKLVNVSRKIVKEACHEK